MLYNGDMRKIVVFTISAVLLITLSVSAAFAVNKSTTPVTTRTKSVTANVQVTKFDPSPVIDLNLVGQLVNGEREKVGLQPLVRDPLLDRSAQDKCTDMITKDYWAHNAPDGSTPWHFISKYNVYKLAGENLAYGQKNSQRVVSSWMNSPDHRSNILDINFTNVGYAQCEYAKDSKEGDNTLIVQYFTDNPTN
jgi:uncharacterized protein YkwD